MCTAGRAVAAALWMTAAGSAAAAEIQPAPSAVAVIELWLVANFELPPASEPPILASARDTALVEARYGHNSLVAPGDVMAVYDRKSRTILLNENAKGDSVPAFSILVHEMVHHLQASAGMTFACPAEAEALAYRAQDEWLKLFGTDLESAFGIDAATLLVATVCTH